MEKKYLKLKTKDNLEVKITFFDLNEHNSDEDEEPQRYRMRLIKKRGDLSQWYSMFNDMKDTVFEDVLLAPRAHHNEVLTTASDDE